MQHLDFKCELRDPALAGLVLPRIGAQFVAKVRQRDTYYRVPDGRLKKRESENEQPEYIVYHRLDRPLPTISHFVVLSEEQMRTRYGERELPVWLRVEKTREIWLVEGAAHLHLDEVQRLGWFLEVDALIAPHHHVGKAHELTARLRAEMGPALGEPIATSYADLMALELEDELGGNAA